jgi:hypothetical protein
MVDIAGEAIVRITIVEDVIGRKNMTKTILLTTTMRNDPNKSGEARSEGSYT